MLTKSIAVGYIALFGFPLEFPEFPLRLLTFDKLNRARIYAPKKAQYYRFSFKTRNFGSIVFLSLFPYPR